MVHVLSSGFIAAYNSPSNSTDLAVELVGVVVGMETWSLVVDMLMEQALPLVRGGRGMVMVTSASVCVQE